ncbi:hypothetical protein QYE76_056011 [Lolium multiflorum]|uniref:Uncharacterized protein n=1 Tax=Lolium multiflorum TaxID=4521 RepID=A0AAD8WME7_LOLMU|nr:hypothetical protein QYE76_056011 [Lolium multiflorum]
MSTPLLCRRSEAKPKDSWKNILSADERASAEELFAKFLRIKEADGQTMIGTEVAAVFLKRRIQPVMARVHPMWLYSGPKDETRINAADLSEKELLDEVRRLTSFNQEDSIPLISSYAPLDVDHPPSGIPMASENTRDSPDDTSEGKGSSIPVDFHTIDQTGLEDEYNGPMNLEVAHADLPSSADNTCIADGSVRNVDTDRDTFVDTSCGWGRASPAKRSTGGFADEDDLFDIDGALSSLLLKRPSLMLFRRSWWLPKLRLLRLPPWLKHRLRLPFPKGRIFLQLLLLRLLFFESSSSKLDGAVKIAAAAYQEIDSLKEELARLKGKLKEEEASRLVAEARAAEKDEVLRQSSLALLEAANIPVDALERVPNNSPANAVSTILASHQLTQELLVKGKGALARMHSMIFPKIKQEKTLGQLIDTFAVDTKEVIEVFKRTSRTFGAVLAFQLMMGYGFKGDIEEMTKGLPKGQDGQPVDLSTFKASALTCARQLLELVFPVPSFADDSSGALPESDRIQRMKDRMTQMEKDLRSTYALAAIINKSEIAADVERYILGELHKATETCLLSIANATGDFEELYPKVLAPVHVIVDRLEEMSKIPEEKETPPINVFRDICHDAFCQVDLSGELLHLLFETPILWIMLIAHVVVETPRWVDGVEPAGLDVAVEVGVVVVAVAA